MKTILQKITFAFILTQTVWAQAQQPRMACGTDEAMEAYFKSDPQARQRFNDVQQALKQGQNQNAAARPAAFQYTVPVVFHILHQGGPENISDAACIAALKQINDDYARRSPDTTQIFSPFKNLYIDSEIKFMLAKKDPQGNCISGIIRHIDPKTNWSQALAAQASYWPYTWDPTKYLNIYIVGNIISNGPISGGQVGGYTYLPGTWPTGNAHDAIVYRYSMLGVNFPNPDSRALSHEMGHWLGLPHPFGNTNNPGITCGDDGILDTPPTKGNYNACPAASTNTNYTCSSPDPTNSNLYYQNAQNIMDYSNCPKNFTTDQTTFMRNSLASSVSGRQNLWQPSNLAFTDINSVIPCAPVAEFLSTNLSYTVCAGGNLTMKDFSYNGVITTYAWSAGNSATLATPGASQTLINFPVMGVSNVTLTVSNSQGSDTKVRTVYVLDNTPGINGPVFESFENPGLPPNWSITDLETDGFTWQQTTLAAYDQVTSYYIEGAIQPASTSDYLQMPIMDVKNNPGAVLEFAYAYAQHHSTLNDVLRVQGSRDCGGTWNDIVVLSAATMASGSGGVDSAPFVPFQEQWKIYPLSSHPNWLNYINSTNVSIRFNFVEGIDGFGNNLYVDAINMYVPVGINELTKSLSFGLYPNPTSAEASVHFTLNDPAHVKISVLDVLGKEVVQLKDQNYSAGEQTVAVNTDHALPKGIYFVKMSVNGATMSSKLVIN